jgi:membrane protease YdiL (CAAX protease family)
LSFRFSALVVSLIFTAIHPQGMLAVPFVMTLALALTIIREWRGTLLPGMVVQGLSGGITLWLLTLILGQ